MNATLYEALNLTLRWTHVLTAILWVGQTFLFTWLDAQFRPTSGGDPDNEPVWMVHSGGFYRIEKIVRPTHLPDPLHWTRWESLLTWASGFGLLLLMYTFGGLLRAPGSSIGTPTLVAMSLGSLVAGWLIYDVLWSSPLGRREPLAAAISLLLLMGLTWSLMQALSTRAAWFHVGAMLGGLMTGNVWMRILPPQRRMVISVASGEHLDPFMELRRKAALATQHLHGAAAVADHAEQPLPHPQLRTPPRLGHARRVGAPRLGNPRGDNAPRALVACNR